MNITVESREVSDLVNKIRKYSNHINFTIKQVDTMKELAKLIAIKKTTISKIQKYFEENPEELKNNFGEMKLYAVIKRIRKLKKEMT